MSDGTPDPDNKRYLFDDPRNVDRLLHGFYAVCAVLLGLDLILHRHVSHSWENLVGFYALFGFVACVILVLVAKEMRKVLMRSEDYYDVDR
jgi:hypothetical protein